MKWNSLFISIVFLLTAYIIYQWIKNRKPFSKENRDGPILPLYVQGWGVFIICVLMVIVFFLKSLPLEI